MSPPVKTYDAAAISLIFKGALITGIAEGTFVEVARAADSWFNHVGGDGEVTRGRNNNRTGTVKFTLTQSSPSNNVLSAFCLADENTGAGVGSLLVKDTLGSALCDSPEAYVLKPADLSYSNEPSETREWTIFCRDLGMLIGGVP